jgi:hypothetical protein
VFGINQEILRSCQRAFQVTGSRAWRAAVLHQQLSVNSARDFPGDPSRQLESDLVGQSTQSVSVLPTSLLERLHGRLKRRIVRRYSQCAVRFSHEMQHIALFGLQMCAHLKFLRAP